MTKLMQEVYEEKIKLDGMEHPTNNDWLHYNEQLQHFFKYVDSCRDIFDNKFLVFIYNLNNVHWTVIIVVNPFLVFDRYLFGDKYINVHEDDFAGWCVIDSLGGGRTHLQHEYLTGTSSNQYHPELGVHLFLNYCASFVHGLYTSDTVIVSSDSHQASSLKDVS
jgi:hypothetical protein